MSDKLEQSEFLDKFDANRDNQKDQGKNSYFLKNRGGKIGGDFGGHKGGGDFKEREGNREIERFTRNNREGFSRGYRGGYPENSRGGERGGFRGLNRGRGGRGRYWRGDYNQRRNFRESNNRMSEFNNGIRYFDNNNRDYHQMEYNFVKRNEESEEYNQQKEALYEKKKFWNDFKKKYEDIIMAFKTLFVNEQPTEEEIYQIILNINNTNLTIFEAMNLIYREIQINKTLQFMKTEHKREYGPNKDIFPQQKYQEVIPVGKILRM